MSKNIINKKRPKRFKEERLFIYLDALLVRCIIGVNPEERIHEQEVKVDLTLELSTKIDTSGVTSAHSVDWVVVGDEVKKTLQERKFYLAEEAARQVAMSIIQSYPVVRSSRVKIIKPFAYPDIAAVAAESWIVR